MKNIRILIISLLFLTINLNFFCQEPNFHFRKIQVDDGLSENAVNCILQDSKGYMWFGTKDGLNRFDGSNFRAFRTDVNNLESIGNNFIRSMTEDKNNTFYIGTDAGLYIMDSTEETFLKLNIKTDEGVAITSAINTLYLDNMGYVWIGSMFQGIFMYDPKSNQLKHVNIEGYTLGQNATWTIYGDKSGTIWVGTRLGLLRYNPSREKLEAIDNLFGLSDNLNNEILCIQEDDKGNLWLGTWSDGIRLYNKYTNKYTSYLGINSRSHYITHVRSILKYSDSSLLIGSDDGLYLFDLETQTTKRVDTPHLEHSMSDQNVYSLARDKEGSIWIGTYFGGVNYLNMSSVNVETYYPNHAAGALSGKAVSQFCEDPLGNLWIATEDGGINYLDTKTNIITQPVKTSYHNTHALLLDDTNLWIGTFSRGIDVFNTRTKSVTNFRNNTTDKNTLNDDCIFSLYKTKNGKIYAGTPVGLNMYNKESNSFSGVKEVAGFIYDMEEDDYGNLWVATYGTGVMRLETESGKWIHYDTIQARNNPAIGSKLTGVYIDNQKRVIFSSEGQGIFIYDYKTDNFKNISENDGLPNGVIYGILDDLYGNLWISCNKGIVCLNTSDPKNFRLYNKEDGLQSNQFNYKSSYKAKNGKFYFGGINGFNCFYPQDLNKDKNLIMPPVEITGLHLLSGSSIDTEKEIQKRLNGKQKIELPYNKSSFTVSYISLSFISQTKNQYAYQLEGVDNDWYFAGNKKEVTYVNLPPGEYVFRVKASNNDGVWNEKGTEIVIKILPPFWLSIPAKTIYIILFCGLAYFLFSYYLRKNKEKQAQQLESFKTEQETLAFKSKIDFFTTIAHEIRTPLSLINAPLEEIISSGDGGGETQHNLSIIEKNCNRLTVLINQLLDFRKMESTQYVVKPETVNLRDHINELYERFKKTAQSRKIDFELQLSQETDFEVISDTDALTKIIGNLLTNALKYTKDKIVLSVEKDKEGEYIVSVEDNGKGISNENKSLIFDPFYQIQSDGKNMGTGIGLSLVKHLSEVLDGKIEITDNTMGGSTFTFTFSDIPQNTTVKENIPENTNTIATAERINTKNRMDAILVVDDNPEITSFIKNCLKNEYQVSTAIDAEEGFKLLDKQNFDLIISDIMMPGMDGITFTQKIKTELNYSHIPVILLSAKTENTTKIEGLSSGADVFIEKPFSMSYLRAQIASLLENRKVILEMFNRSPLASYSALVTNKNDEVFLDRLNSEIEKHISDETFSVESLTTILGLSRSNLQRKLKSICDATPGDYLRNYRLKRACQLLLETDLRINEVAFRVGFNSASYFTKAFFKCYKMSPREFVNKYMDNQDSVNID